MLVMEEQKWAYEGDYFDESRQSKKGYLVPDEVEEPNLMD